MTFDDILAQVLELLQRQGRVSYRALKRRFDLDDAYLEDLKEEMLFTYPVVDEEGRGFVWTGKAERQPVSTSTQPALREVTPAIQHTQAEPPPHASPPPQAERRQLTVMFCDLVNSTTLSSRLDPEEYRDVVRAYHTACTEVIRRYDGYIAQLLGDGLLVYFGSLQAHEDDARRAVRTGLGILAAMENLHTRLPPAKGLTLAVRLGIHTGLVLLGQWETRGVTNT
jgi:class 3 adenylate cyclase